MDIRHLRYVAEINRKRNFTSAAKSLGVAQPALSHAIKALEEEFNVRLFERSSRHVRLTPAGAAFVERAERILFEVESLRTMIEEHATTLRGTVHVGTMLFFGETTLPPIIKEFCRRNAGIDIVLEHESARALLAGLRAGTIDVGFVNIVDVATYPELLFVPIDHDEVAAALPPGHRLADRSRLTFAELCNEPFIAYEPESGMHEALCAMQNVAGKAPNVVIRSRSTHLVRSLVSEGIGVSIGYKKYLESPGPAIVVVPIGPEPIVMSIALAMRPEVESNPAGRAFLDFIRLRFGA